MTSTTSSVGGERYTSTYNYNPSYRPNYSTGSHRPRYNLADGTVFPPLRTDDDKPKPKDVDVLSVESHNYHLSDNRVAHHTDEYEEYNLIVRRGQPFKLSVTFNRPLNKDDRAQLQFCIGRSPKRSKGSLIQLRNSDKLDPKEWSAKVETSTDKTLTYDVMPAPDAIVGTYTAYVNIFYKNEKGDMKIRRHKLPQTIIILFNAWCEDDAVYLKNEDERKEYVMNDSGRVYVGSSRRVSGRPWNFGQFERACLEAVLYLLDQSYLSAEAWGNPTHVTRTLSAMANNNDNDSGVLVGNWSGNYMGGKSPVAWNGSVAILEEYMLCKRGVRFGQCWVFSGLLTTLGRALGIPTRSVTNFQSAHDTDYSMTIDEHRSAVDGRPISGFDDDSVWNFHVWNESWFKRPDLPDGNDGWQAFDSTPQEASEGMMRCGPCPVNAVKEGNVFYGYDSRFIFAEVNGDKVVWFVTEDGEVYPVQSDTNIVGKSISTKAVLSTDRQDVTSNYKYTEGSTEERKACTRASRHSSRKEILQSLYEQGITKDIAFTFDANGQTDGDILAILNMTNQGTEPRTVDVRMYATARYYTGIRGEELDDLTKKVTVQPGQDEKVEMEMKCVDYMCKLDEDAKVAIYLSAMVEETHQRFCTQEGIEIDKPDIELELENTNVKKNVGFEVTVRFKNLLSIRLTGCKLTMEGPGISREITVPIKRVLAPGEEICEKVTLTPHMAGTREIIVNLHSQQLTGITGARAVTIAV